MAEDGVEYGYTLGVKPADCALQCIEVTGIHVCSVHLRNQCVNERLLNGLREPELQHGIVQMYLLQETVR